MTKTTDAVSARASQTMMAVQGTQTPCLRFHPQKHARKQRLLGNHLVLASCDANSGYPGRTTFLISARLQHQSLDDKSSTNSNQRHHPVLSAVNLAAQPPALPASGNWRPRNKVSCQGTLRRGPAPCRPPFEAPIHPIHPLAKIRSSPQVAAAALPLCHSNAGLLAAPVVSPSDPCPRYC